MYSFPNYIPLPAASVQAVGAALAPFTFERIYGAWWGAVIEADGSGIVRRSVSDTSMHWTESAMNCDR